VDISSGIVAPQIICVFSLEAFALATSNALPFRRLADGERPSTSFGELASIVEDA
jgi:hypothetical protein